MMVEAGTTRFALVVTDTKKATLQLNMLNRRKNEAAYNNGLEKDKTFEQQIINAVLEVVGDGNQSGISFYMTINTGKDKFVKVDLIPATDQEATKSPGKPDIIIN